MRRLIEKLRAWINPRRIAAGRASFVLTLNASRERNPALTLLKGGRA